MTAEGETPSPNGTNDDDSSGSTSQNSAMLPDGGYGWVITFASFMCHFISDGMAFTFGIVYPSLLEEFQDSKSVTSWIGSLFHGVPLICGPIAGLSVSRFGCRKTTIFGGLLTAVGLLASAFVTSVELMSVTYGIVAGFGLAFIYVPSTVIPSFWFEKKRSLATGIAVSGSGVGTFVMAPLMDFLMDEYGWRGAVLISAGIGLNMVVFGALYRNSPESSQRPKPEKSSACTRRCTPADGDQLTGSPGYPDDEPSSPDRLYMSDGFLASSSMAADEFRGMVSEHHNNSFRVKTLQDSERHRASSYDRVPCNQLRLDQLDRTLLPKSRHDISSVLWLAELRRHTSSCPHLATSYANLGPLDDSANHRTRRFVRKAVRLGQELCDVRLFAIPVYLLFFISNFTFNYSYELPYIYLPDYANDHQIARSSFLVSIIGIVNTIGQILYGFLGDNKKIDTVVLYGASILLCGLLVTLTPFMKTYTPLAVTYGFFGLLISANFALDTIILIEILSLDRLTKAYSLLMFGQGVAALIGPPIGGAFWDLTQTYTYTFVFAGLSMAASGVMVLVIKLVQRCGAQSANQQLSGTAAAEEDNSSSASAPYTL